MRPFEIIFKNVGEIRHGSPYNIAELVHTGPKYIKLKAHNSWQDKLSWSPNGNFVALVKWEHNNSDPCFLLILVDSKTGVEINSTRIEGCCEKIRLSNDLVVKYKSFTLLSENNSKKEYGIKDGEYRF